MKWKNKANRCVKIFLTFLLGMFTLSGVYAQSGSTITVRGNVKDNLGDVIGASVVVKGSTNGVMTDLDGNFEIDAPSNGTLIISFVGFDTQEVAVAGRKNISVILVENAKLLKDVIVIGYGSVKKEDATGSVTAIKVDELNKGLSTSASDLLTGKVAGVNINTEGGEPGSKAVIRIRGGSSLTASNDPLIVIDGIPMNSDGPAGLSNPLSTVNPADIESFTILKDASATAIYGSRASNGVIIITTKKGRVGQGIKVSYNGNVTISKNAKTVDVLNASEYRQFLDDRFGGTASYGDATALLGSANTDWQDEIYRTAVSTDHNLSLFGSMTKDNFPFRASVGYTNQEGVLLNSNFQRGTGSFSTTPTFFENHLSVSVNAKGSYSRAKRADTGAVGAALSMDPTQVVKNGSKYNEYFTWLTGDGTPNNVAPGNGVAMLNLKDDISNIYAFVGNVQADYKLHFFPDLRFNANLGIDYSDSDGKVVVGPEAAMNFTNGGYNKRWDTTRKNTILDLYSQYVKDVEAIDSRFDIMGGYSWQHFHGKGTETAESFTKYNSDGTLYQYADPRNWASESYLVSFFGRFNYTFKERYLLTSTFRYDGTSRFHKDQRWGMFPSLSLAWKLKEESFLKDVSALSDLKARLGWGITGQQNISKGDYPYMAIYKLAQGQANALMGYDANGNPIWVPVMRPSTYNPKLKWEETVTYNGGLDFGFLNNRISGSIDYYYRKTEDMINAETKVPSGANFGEFVISNIGNMTNRGFEFSILGKPIVTEDLVWDVNFNLAYNKSKITKLNSDTDSSLGKAVGWVGGEGGGNSQIHSVGYSPFAFYLHEQIYDNDGNPIEGAYIDQDKNGVINENDKIFYKKPTPDVTMGFGSKVLYKNWDFGFNARVSLGNYVYNDVAASSANIANNMVFSKGAIANIQKSALKTNFSSRQLYSTYYVEKASFLKMDNITLGYTFENLLKRAGFNARIHGTVQNVFCITPYDGIDPEVPNNNGIDRNLYPRPISFIVGVNLNF